MTKRVIISGVIGGIVFFMWGFVSWAVASWHNDTIVSHAGITAVIDDAEAHLPGTGVYYFPPMPDDHEDQAAMDAWEQAHREGPIGMLFWRPDGMEPIAPSTLAKGLLLDVAMAMIAAVLLCLALPSLPSYGVRVCYVAGIGVLAAMATRFTDAIFMAFPGRYTMGQAIDGIVGWVFVGLVLAMIVKPRH